ncbi:MAG: hypothetical protein N2643_04035, partial [Endomicrobia bacterium]|nr:hypothetical protein [Endomicrobiia bacterium]
MIVLDIIKLINFFSAFFCLSLALTITQCKLPSFKELKSINFSVFMLSITSALWALNMGMQLLCINTPTAAEFFTRLNWIGGLIVA